MADRPPLTPALGADDHVQGPRDGDGVLELVEYADFQCPHCARAAAAVIELRTELGDRLRFGFRHFPLARRHPQARKAAEAAEAAAAQSAFWPMHDLLMARASALSEADLLSYAAELGLDVDRFASELSAGVHGPRVQRDVGTGARSGVNGTPTFFVNGLRHNGPYDVSSLRAALTSEP